MSKASDSADCFSRYSDWYDTFYSDKNYRKEAAYVLDHLLRHGRRPESWLDVGCGTGRHAAFLAETGIPVEGVDASKKMIEKARAEFPHIPFTVGEAGDFVIGKQFMAASMLFHVFNYLGPHEKVFESLSNISRHLLVDGYLVFDFWHTDAIELDPPRLAVRAATVDDSTIYRLAYPLEDRARQRIKVHYEFREGSETGKLIHEERHLIHHFRVPEMQSLLRAAGFEPISCEGWMTGKSITRQNWYGIMLATKQS